MFIVLQEWCLLLIERLDTCENYRMLHNRKNTTRKAANNLNMVGRWLFLLSPPIIHDFQFCYRTPEKDSLLFHRGPGLVGIVGFHFLGDLHCVRSKVLLINLSPLIDDKGHHP
jgi:hypothetical protein